MRRTSRSCPGRPGPTAFADLDDLDPIGRIRTTVAEQVLAVLIVDEHHEWQNDGIAVGHPADTRIRTGATDSHATAATDLGRHPCGDRCTP
jgi:hypothetical protein